MAVEFIDGSARILSGPGFLSLEAFLFQALVACVLNLPALEAPPNP